LLKNKKLSGRAVISSAVEMRDLIFKTLGLITSRLKFILSGVERLEETQYHN